MYKQLQEQSITNAHTVINLSSQPLTPKQTQLLSKNLNFCPTPSAINLIHVELNEDLYRFSLRLRLAEFFYDEDDEKIDHTTHSQSPPPAFLRKPSSFTPDSGRDLALDTFIKGVSSEFMLERQRNIFSNLRNEEKEALRELIDNDKITIC
ncbi:hypothetical protein RRG08_000022 [Elysia crispata]|uniref:Uncharacterized protein n=1 Tax=Elysia crispata TaxID=231223 RepID=A0AAE0Y616_9GAST|nr:hypothetical protein RRG08_000022 [Elysia crispata]